MKVLLFQALWRRIEKPIYPLGLAYLAGALKERHQVLCLDENLMDSGADLMERIAQFNPDVIGMSMRNADAIAYSDFVRGLDQDPFSVLAYVRDAAQRLKQNFPDKPLIIGGPAFSIFARRVMEVAQHLDFGVIGEGERTLPLLLDHLHEPEKVPGLIYRRNGDLLSTGTSPLLPFSQIGDPDYTLMNVQPYLALGEQDIVGIQSNRGCGLQCAYCVYPSINGAKVRRREIARVMDEIQALIEEHGLTHFQFADSVFNHPQKHAEEICQEIIRRGLKVEWSAWFDLKTLNASFMKLAIQAGCCVFELSPDGFTDRTLKALRKNITQQDILRVCRLSRKLPGARVRLNFLCNAPADTVFSMLALLVFMVRLKLFYRGRIAATINSIRIMPNTQIYQLAIQEGIIKPGQELLPINPQDLLGTYYRPKSGYWIEKIYDFILLFGKYRRQIIGLLRGRNARIAPG